MLRAGLCDLGTCDLEIGCRPVHRARPDGTSCGSPARSRTVSPAREEGVNAGAYSRHAARRAISSGLPTCRMFPLGGPLTCCLTAWQATACHICARRADRKSTRLNSSHVEISYAVCCL